MNKPTPDASAAAGSTLAVGSALCTLYADTERNALMTALQNAAKAYSEGAPYTAEDMIYCYVEAAPKTSLVSELIDELHRLGYRIQPNINWVSQL
jgi:hypothetical protein